MCSISIKKGGEKMSFYMELQEQMKKVVRENNLDEDSILIKTASLTPEEAIGITSRKDFPLLNGKEILVEANYKGSIGQAYTDVPTALNGSIKDILDLDLSHNRNKVLFIAAINAILKHLNLIDNTIHCKDDEPEKCGKDIERDIKNKYGNVKIGVVGFQPAIIDNLRRGFPLMVLDLDSNNIGKEKYGILIEDGKENVDEVLNWADILMVTGSTITNGSIVNFLDIKKPVLFYGTTIAGAAYLKGLNRICGYAK